MNIFNTILLSTALCVASSTMLSAQSNITVDLNSYDWAPLDKTKMAIFQECDHQNGHNYQAALERYPEIDIHSFRMLVSFGRKTRTFNNDLQFKMVDGKVSVTADEDMVDFVRFCQDSRIMPVVTMFETPEIFRDEVNNKHNSIPADMSGYSKALAEYASIYRQKDLTVMWEMWNEPNLQQFIFSDDYKQDYMRFYNATVPAVRAADPDACITGPSPATADSKLVLFDLFFETLEKSPSLTPDYFAFHYYGRESPHKGDLPVEVDLVREYMGDNYNHVPLMVTEYEYYSAGNSAEDDIDRAKRETPVGAATLLKDIAYYSEQLDFEYIHWNRLIKNGESSREGGVFSHNMGLLPHYYARMAYNAMPEDRVKLDMGSSKLEYMASRDDNKVALLLWSDEDITEKLNVDMKGLSSKLPRAKSLRVSRYVATKSNPRGELIVEEMPLSALLNLTFSGAGFMLIEVAEVLDVEKERYAGLDDLRWIRNYRLCERLSDGSLTGNFAIPNSKEWSVRLGTRKAGSVAVGGFKLAQLPKSLVFNTSVVGDKAMPELSVGIVYELDGVKYPVVVGGDSDVCQEFDELMWGFGDFKYVGSLSKSSSVNLDRYAPKGWSTSERKASIVLLSKGVDTDTQVVVDIRKN